ncbi:MAG: fatty acid oxidation complex subunit alpha FadJ [Gemmatimonadota bacterium]|nr:fatty acid oxidation complex subunit alpha FadJ [Gemmatimonadota bacterium]
MTATGEMKTGSVSSGAFRTEMEDGVVIVTFDMPGSVNKLDDAVGRQVMALFDKLDHDTNVKAVVVMSAKPDSFIVGADIEQFVNVKEAAEFERMSRDGQRMLDRVERARAPVVAAIHGSCMGGGLEMALACAYRICTDHPKTILSFPETQLGLIPGAGGTQRLPRAVGLRNALDMILSAKNIRAKKALQIGLVDEMVHPSILRDIAMARAKSLSTGEIKRTRARVSHGASDVVLEDNPVGRSVIFRKAREQALEKSHGHYPAIPAAIDAIRFGIDNGMEAGLAEEARLFGKMAATEVSKQLVFLFFATTALKKDPGVDGVAPKPKTVTKIGILGAGFMGAGIAAVTVMQDLVVRLKDAENKRVAAGLKAVSDVLRERVKRKQVTRRQYEDQMALVGGTTDYSGFASADLVVEAVFEDLGVKQKVLQETEAILKPGAIFASNTSTIPIGLIAEASRDPANVIGMHFFSPVHKMPLLEVIRAKRTSAETVVSTVAFGKKLGKTTIVVNDAPGFYVNRILAPYVNEAGRLLDEGVAIGAIDKALVDFGFPVGPITLIDEVGLDIAGKSGKVMLDAFGDRMAPGESIKRVIESGRMGRKGKKGFYLYDEEGKKGGIDESVYAILAAGAQRREMPAQEIQQRCVLAMVNEAARCLEDGILRQPRDGDVGAVFGIGFPPFRGGPFRYLDTMGVANAVRALESLHLRYAPRFEPAGVLADMAEKAGRFYPAEGMPF